MEEQHNQEKSNKNWYDKTYKFFFFIPLIILLFSIVYLINFEKKEGDIVKKDVTLKGGTIITVFDANADIKKIESQVSIKFSDVLIRKISEFGTGTQRGFILETGAEPSLVKEELEKILGYSLTQENSSIEFSKETISKGFYHQLRYAVLLAFALMALAVFIVFRTFVPSIAVIFSALSDILMTIAVTNMMGVSVSVAGIVAFLMLIGYSVDTDILLTSRVLRKKEGTINERIYGAFKTGATMTLTAIVAVFVAWLMIHTSSAVLGQMFLILLVGLSFDLLNTWGTNASIIKWYAERKEAKK